MNKGKEHPEEFRDGAERSRYDVARILLHTLLASAADLDTFCGRKRHRQGFIQNKVQ